MHSAARPGPVSIDQAVLRGLSASSAVEAFRDLLWARAGERGIPVTRVSISSDVFTPDGGVDASILDGGGAKLQDDELLSSGKRFQIKTGDFQPWKPATIKRELFGTKAQKFENLGGAVQRTLREGKEFVLVCFGVDPVGENLRKATDNLAAAFKACGFPNARVAVWGQTAAHWSLSAISVACASGCGGTTIKAFAFGLPGRQMRTCSPRSITALSSSSFWKTCAGICNPDDSPIYGCSGSLALEKRGWHWR